MWGESRLRYRQIGDCHRLVHIRVDWFAFYVFHTPSVLVFFPPVPRSIQTTFVQRAFDLILPGKHNSGM